MTIGEKIKILRKSHNLSAKKLGEKIGLSQQYISDIENNRSNPSIETLEKIVSYFHLSLANFFKDNKADKTLSCELEELLNNAKYLSKEQIEILTKLVKTMKK